MRVNFTVPGYPQPKQRHRFVKKTGRSYTPQATMDFEARVREIAAPLFAEPLTGPIGMTIIATFKMAKSWSQKKRAAHIGRSHTQKPDLTNLAKSLEDGLNTVAYADDSQIAASTCVKVWGDIDQTVVIVEQI